MQWQADRLEHRGALDRAFGQHERGLGTGNGFVYAPKAWEHYEVDKPASDNGGSKEKGHELWTIGRRMDRSNFGQSTRELPRRMLSTVYGLLAFAMAFTAVGVVAGYRMGMDSLWLLVFANLGLIFAIVAWREVERLNLVLLYSFSASTGLLLGPVIAELANVGMLGLVVQAALATSVITGCLFVIGLRIEQDLYAWQPYLFAALLAFVVVQAVNLFLFNTPIDQLLIGFGGVVLFSSYLIFDVNRIHHVENTMGNAVMICLDIYLDILNLFLNLLQILVEIVREGD
jgi:uncharacterized protein